MSNLVLNLTKPGDVATKLSLNLTKDEEFKVRLSWAGKTDLDLHALVTYSYGDGQPAKASSFDDVLSTYNVKRTIRGQDVGTLVRAADGSFSVHGGALVHSPDVVEGSGAAEDDDDGDEFIIIRPSKLIIPTGGLIEIPLLAMIHPQGKGKTFSSVEDARVIIEDADGNVLANASLSGQFGPYVGVQMGSVLIEQTGSSFATVGVGFNTDFNGVLGQFS
jgi:tellurium resistance protein TerD